MQSNRSRQRGFTLVEMLVVLGIIAVLVGLLLPAVMGAINSARRTQMAMEISQLDQAINAYKNEFGDYPPSMGEDYSAANRYNTAVERHLRKCFPKMTPTEKTNFYDNIAPTLDQGEALVAWLSKVSKNPREPFTDTASEKYVFYQFDERRLVDNDGDSTFAYRTKHAGDTCYIYIDARSYLVHQKQTTNDKPAKAESTDPSPEGAVRPYYTTTVVNAAATSDFQKYRPVNHTSFQIICAGQDGQFSQNLDNCKAFPEGTNYDEADMDNITNFSDGGRLEDRFP